MGGIITGDKVKMDFETCPCGRPSPSVLEVQRYSELEGDDKITCSATFDTYVRGLTSEGELTPTEQYPKYVNTPQREACIRNCLHDVGLGLVLRRSCRR